MKSSRASPWGIAAFVQAIAIVYLLVHLLADDAAIEPPGTSPARAGAPMVAPSPSGPAGAAPAGNEPAAVPASSPRESAPSGATAVAGLGTLVHGGVTARDGSTPASAWVSLFAGEQTKQLAQVSLSRQNTFAIPGLAAGDYRLTARSDNMRSFERAFTVPPATADLRVDVVLEPSWLVRVQLLAPDGGPLAEALAGRQDLPLGGPFGLVNVVAAWQELPAQLPLSDLRDTPFSVASWQPRGMGRGSGELPARYAGALEMREDRPAMVAAVMRETLLVQAPVQPGQDEVALTVDPQHLVAQLATVRLQVVDAAGKPVADAKVGLNDAQSFRQPGTTDGEGRFEQAKMRPGRYQFTVDAGGSSAPVAFVDLAAGRTTDLGAVVVTPTCKLRIRLAGSADDKQVSASLLSLDAVPNAALSPRSLRLPVLKGEIQRSVVPGRYRLRVTAGDKGAALELDTRQLGDEPMVVTLAPEPTLQVDPGQLAEPTRFVLRTAAGAVVYDRWITWKGVFPIQLPAGQYRATLQGLRGDPRQEAIALPASGDKYVLR